MNQTLQIAAVNIPASFGSPFSDRGISSLVSLILTGSLAIAGILILFLLIFAGFSIIMGAGSSNPESIEKGKKAAGAALIGFILVFAAYWIIRIIELISGAAFITQPPV